MWGFPFLGRFLNSDMVDMEDDSANNHVDVDDEDSVEEIEPGVESTSTKKRKKTRTPKSDVWNDFMQLI